jgi:hypothetical protein
MKSFMGRAPALDGNGFIADLQFLPKCVTSIVDLTVTANQSGTFFFTTAATEAEINFTLPAITDGPYWFMFINTADINLKVTAETADTMTTFNDIAADSASFETSSEKIGAAFMVVCDGTDVVAIPMGAGGHVQTLTVGT